MTPALASQQQQQLQLAQWAQLGTCAPQPLPPIDSSKLLGQLALPAGGGCYAAQPLAPAAMQAPQMVLVPLSALAPQCALAAQQSL